MGSMIRSEMAATLFSAWFNEMVDEMERRYHDVTQPTPRDRKFQLLLSGIGMVLSPVLTVVFIVYAVRSASAGEDPAGAIVFAVVFALATVFAVVRFRGLKSRRGSTNPDDAPR